MKNEMEAHEAWMSEALLLARHAASLGEVPVGSVAVVGGQVVGRGYNRREIDQDPVAHAEMLALAQAAEALGVWRLSDVTLYVTLEPCAMCAGAMVQSRLGRLVFGARDGKAGAVGSLYNLVEEPRHNHQVQVLSGVMENDCSAVLKEFFQRLRARGR